MDSEKINSISTSIASAYLEKKFRHFKKGFYTKASRRKKCMMYWIAAEPSRRELVEMVYQRVFGELFDDEVAEQLEEQLSRQPIKVASQDDISDKRKLKLQAQSTLATLKKWKEDGEWQEDGFVERLQMITAFMEEDDICDEFTFKSEFNSVFEKELTGSLQRGDKSVEQELEFMVGAKQHARIEFSAFRPDWGKVSGFFEENFKGGIWGNESAKVAWSKSGFSAEVKAAIAIGMQLNLEGELSWENRDHKLSLGGQAEVFLGAKGNLEASLSLNARKGLQAAFDAGFFAGFSASVSGSAKFMYMDKEIASVDGEASFIIGVSGTVTASLSVPFWGPTTVEFGAGLSIGMGGSASVKVSVNFKEASILLATEFRKVVYIPTLLQGYKMDIQVMEYRNSFYLNKCIDRLNVYIKDMEEEITSYKKIKVEKRPLLATKGGGR